MNTLQNATAAYPPANTVFAGFAVGDSKFDKFPVSCASDPQARFGGTSGHGRFVHTPAVTQAKQSTIQVRASRIQDKMHHRVLNMYSVSWNINECKRAPYNRGLLLLQKRIKTVKKRFTIPRSHRLTVSGTPNMSFPTTAPSHVT
ncbi:MAG: hypothetical protein LBE78_05585 [Burkholderiaceae bacterium]|nr:hypothetical protein [Burkholderiaceae bacterium]